ncbi:MAG: SDR family NAD(P)-dependent oxidoreductase [Candidatus Marinamargulisbacteria bacterium]
MTQQTALITGANRGIGFEIANALSAKGVHVLLGCRDTDAANKAAQTLPGASSVVPLDLADAGNLQSQLTDICEACPPVDILINNAAILIEGSALSISQQAFNESMQVNMMSVFTTMQALVPGMVARGYGRVVNLSSGWGSMSDGCTGPAAYSISKAALNALTLSFSQAVPSSVKINAACPGWVRTRMGGMAAPRSAAKGAETPVWLATLPDDGPTGGFFRDQQLISW